MQGIEQKQHQDMLRVIAKFEALMPLYGNYIPPGYEEMISEMSLELKGTHDYYTMLLKEVEDCIRSYAEMHDSLRKIIYPSVRKMNTKSKK